MAKKTDGQQLVFETSIKVDIERIKPNPYQPKGRIEPPAEIVDKVATSIELYGLLQTPVVRQMADGTYEMGDGWIRCSAYKKLCFKFGAEWQLMPVCIRELTDQQMADMIFEANTVRHDLSPIDLGQLYRDYLTTFSTSQAELARQHHISQGELANTMRLLELPDEVQQLIILRKITATHGLRLLQLPTSAERVDFAEKTHLYDMNVATLDSMIKEYLATKKADGAETTGGDACAADFVGITSAIDSVEIASVPQNAETRNDNKEEEPADKGKTKPSAKPPEKPKAAVPPVKHGLVTNPATPRPVPVSQWKRKLIIQETSKGILLSIMAAGKFPVMKNVPGDIEEALGELPEFLAEANQKWEGK